MKLKNILTFVTAATAVLGLASCENQDKTFDDYEGGTSVYFAHQTPVRTLVLGRDSEVNNDVDNSRHMHVYATMGGAYEGRDITITTTIDNTLCDNLFFEDGVTPVKPLPESYYKIANNQINYNGDHWGYLDVELTEAFFADEQSATTTYVLPVLMKSQTGADRIITGTPDVEGDVPSRTNTTLWKVPAKDYVLYCVRYINPWTAKYLRRGTDVITENGVTTTVERKSANWENEEVVEITTKGLRTALFTVSTKDAADNAVACDLLLTINDNNECTVTSLTEGITATGTGKYTNDGEKLAWGNKDRDAIDLEYTVDYGFKTVKTTDRLVMQTRGTNKLVEFSTKYIN